ncbi:MAG: hypothetical protein EXR31_07265 [Betaproteobacteria bacterium]|nr:hypothetical protein [Betaproteobacteria bacterium]
MFTSPTVFRFAGRSRASTRTQSVTWNTEDEAKAFISSKGGDADFQPVALTDDAMDKLAAAIGAPVEAITFDPYPS